MKKILLLTLFLTLPLVIAAADVEEKSSAPNKEQSERKEEKSMSPVINSSDSFEPTETLSQDVPAAFPTDI
jgi:hypothetical protein|tara:strand:+ start:114 stop:326 length:213 start_codon:yes stop_codon:yes gene_type:complete